MKHGSGPTKEPKGYHRALEKESYGTEILLNIKPNTEENNYDEFLDTYTIKESCQKYSDYIRYPIRMDVEKSA